MAASRRMAERTPNPGSCTRNGTCLTHGSGGAKAAQVLLRSPESALSGFDTNPDPAGPAVSRHMADPTLTTIPVGGPQTARLGVDQGCVGATRCADDSRPACVAVPVGCGASPGHATRA